MINLNNEERVMKLDSASFALKKYFDYFHIDDSRKGIYDKLSTGNSFIEIENLIEYAGEKGLKLSKQSFTKEEFLAYGKEMFPLIATVNKEGLEAYVVIQKKSKDTLTIIDEESVTENTVEDFFAKSNFECIVSHTKHSYINLKFVKDEFMDIVKNKNVLLSTLCIQAGIYALANIIAVVWLNSFDNDTLKQSTVFYLIILVSFAVLGMQISLLSHSGQVINSIALINDTLKIDKYLLKSSKIIGDKNIKNANDYIEGVKKESINPNLSVTNFVLTTIFSGVVMFIALVTTFTQSVAVGAIWTIASVILIISALVFGKKSNLLSLKAKNSEKDYFKQLEEVSRFAKESRLIGENPVINDIKSNKFNEYVKANFELEKLESMFKTSVDLFIVVIELVVLVIYKNILGNQFTTTNIYMMVAFFSIPFILPLRYFVYKLYDKSKIENSYYLVKNCFDLVQSYEQAQKFRISKMREVKFENSIDLKNVHYEYLYKKPILKNINIKIPKGKKVLVYGESGSGKTVLANIILQNLKPTKGEILIDDKNIGKLDTTTFDSKIEYVTDDVQLFDATILENITMFEKISMKRVVDVCQKIGIHSEIQRKAFNYHTKIDSSCTNLSANEIKKIAIARAILRKPEFLIIDGINDVFTDADIEQINILLDESKNLKTVLMLGRSIPSSLNYDIAYNLSNGVINLKTIKNQH